MTAPTREDSQLAQGRRPNEIDSQHAAPHPAYKEQNLAERRTDHFAVERRSTERKGGQDDGRAETRVKTTRRAAKENWTGQAGGLESEECSRREEKSEQGQRRPSEESRARTRKLEGSRGEKIGRKGGKRTKPGWRGLALACCQGIDRLRDQKGIPCGSRSGSHSE